MSGPDGRSDSDRACAHVAPGDEAQSAVDSQKIGVPLERPLEEGPEPTVEAPAQSAVDSEKTGALFERPLEEGQEPAVEAPKSEGEGVADGPVSHPDPPTSRQEQRDEVAHQQPVHNHQPTELAGKASIAKSNAEATNGPSASLPSVIPSATGLFESSVGVHQASANGHGPSSAMGRTETELGDSHDAPLAPLPQTPRVNAVSDGVQAKADSHSVAEETGLASHSDGGAARELLESDNVLRVACPQTPQPEFASTNEQTETDSQETSQDGSPPKAGDGSDVERKTTTPVCLKRWFTGFPSPAYDFGSPWDCAGVLTHMASACMLTRGRDCFRTCAIFPARDVDAHRTPPAESDRRFVDTWLALLGTRSGDRGHWALLCLRPPFGERLEWDVVLLDRQQSPAMRLKARQFANDFCQLLNFNDFPTETAPDELAIQQQNGTWECGLLVVDDARRCLEVPLNIPLRSQLPLFQLPPLNLLLVCLRAMRLAIEPDLVPEKALAEPPRKKSRVSLGKEISVEPVVVSKRAQTDSLKKKRRFPFAAFSKIQRATSAELQGLRADAQSKRVSEMWKSLSPEMRASWS